MSTLPGFNIVATYKAYKIREEKFTTWLRDTGERLGITVPHPKDKDTLAKRAVKINEIQFLVKGIVQSGQSFPENLIYILKDVISQRKDASAFYRPRGQVASDEGHAHYITVLEWALKTLEKSNPRSRPESSATGASRSNSKTDVGLSNLFDLLEIESPKNGSENGASSESESDVAMKNNHRISRKVRAGRAKSNGPILGQPKPSRDKKGYDPDLELLDSIIREQGPRKEEAGEEFEDYSFIVYCFFKDWNYIREYLQERWCDYHDGILSLTTVSLITNTAFEILQRTEYEMLSRLPTYNDVTDYEHMADIFLAGVDAKHFDHTNTNGTLSEMSDEAYERGSWICLGRYYELLEWLDHVPPRKLPVNKLWIDEPIVYRATTYREMQARDRRIIYEMLADCCIIKGMKKRDGRNGFSIPGEDEFTRGAIDMLRDRRIQIWFIFACQIQCDIRYILESDVVECHKELRFAGDRVNSILKEYTELMDDASSPSTRLLNITMQEVDCWIIGDFMMKDRMNLHVGHGISRHLVEPFHYLRRNPILCGLMKFRFTLTMNELGLREARSWGVVFGAAHVYNAMRHEVPFRNTWLDMAAFIMMHTPACIFWRDSPPSSPSQYRLSYEQAAGVKNTATPRIDALALRATAPSKPRQIGLTPVSLVSQYYHQRFCFAGNQDIETLAGVETLLRMLVDSESGLRPFEAANSLLSSHSVFQHDQQILDHNASLELATQFEKSHSLTNIQLLHALNIRVSHESYVLNFDYFSFNIRCMLVLRALYDEFEAEIKEADPNFNTSNGGRDVSEVPSWLFLWLEDETKREDVVERMLQAIEPIIEEEQGNAEANDLRGFLEGQGGWEIEGSTVSEDEDVD